MVSRVVSNAATTGEIRSLKDSVRRTRRRIVLREVLDATAPVSVAVCGSGLLALLAGKLLNVSGTARTLLFALPGLILLVGLAYALHVIRQKRPKWLAAHALDQSHNLKGRVVSALAFTELPPEQRTHMMQAAVADGLRVSSNLSPKKAAPVGVPRPFLTALGLAILIYPVARYQPNAAPQATVAASESVFTPVELSEDDLELLSKLNEELSTSAKDENVIAAVQAFNRLLEDIKNQRADREQVFRTLNSLEDQLEQSGLGEKDWRAALDELGRELEHSKQTKPAAKALRNADTSEAEKQLRRLADDLAKKNAKLSKPERERIAKALEASSKKNAERTRRLNQVRRDLQEGQRRLLRKKQEQGGKLSKTDQSALQRNRRQLKRLDRQKRRADQKKAALSQLDKELQKAAEQLRKELGEKASESLRSGAEALNRSAKRQLSDEEKRALKKQLEELREMLRQNRGNKQARKQLLDKFRKKARGARQGGKPGGKQSGKPGGPKQLLVTKGETPAAGRDGNGAGNKPGGAPGDGRGQHQKGEETELDVAAQDVSVAGVDTGQGESTSEVVYGAAAKGFTARGYKKVYTDYRTVAEEVLSSDEIPPGYKYYVKRYFQLIRPRE